MVLADLRCHSIHYPGSEAMSDENPTSDEHTITARRSSDGFLTFDVRISHIIEQTLLRAFNRPNFRKSTIRVIDDGGGEEDVQRSDCNSERDAEESSLSTSKSKDANKHTSLIAVQLKRKSEDTDGDSCHSKDSIKDDSEQCIKDPVVKRPCHELATTGEVISSIPHSWLSRGISVEERKQFERSIANASLCPYERKRTSTDSLKDYNFQPDLPHAAAAYDEEYAADPFSPSSSPTYPTAVVTAPMVSALYIPQSKTSTASTSTTLSAQDTDDELYATRPTDYFTDLTSEQESIDSTHINDSPYRSPSIDDFQHQQCFKEDSLS